MLKTLISPREYYNLVFTLFSLLSLFKILKGKLFESRMETYTVYTEATWKKINT